MYRDFGDSFFFLVVCVCVCVCVFFFFFSGGGGGGCRFYRVRLKKSHSSMN